jgi:hypothetical protein
MGYAIVLIGVNTAIFLLGALIHGSTYVGINPQDQWPAVQILQVISVVPMCLISMRLLLLTEDPRKWSQDLLPNWIAGTGFLLAAYAFFALVIFNEGGQPAILFDGTLVLEGKSQHIIRILTQAEYDHLRISGQRVFSAFFLLISWISVGLAVMRLRLLARKPRPGLQPEPLVTR